MTTKILKMNGQVVYLSSYHALSEEELSNCNEIAQQDEFNSEIVKRLGSAASEAEIQGLDPDAHTPEYELYADNEDVYQDISPEERPMPDTLDDYVGTLVTL